MADACVLADLPGEVKMALLRSVAAVVGGIAVYSLLLFGATAAGDALLGRNESELINGSVATQILWLIWNIAGMVSAGYAAAMIAPRAPAAHAIVMGTIQALFTLGAMFTAHGEISPPWLWIAVIAMTIPAAWSGARLRQVRSRVDPIEFATLQEGE
jgi:hypothetical protein